MKPTLTELLKSLGGAIPEGKRVYRVVPTLPNEGGLWDEVYVVANSQGQASLTVCTVETVKPKDIQAAALAALAELAKGES